MEKHELYDGEVTLHFYGDGGKHLYVVDDVKPPSSTRITGIIDKPGLRYWYVNQALARVENSITPGRSYDEVQLAKIFKKAKYGGADARDDAASIGKIVHGWIEDHVGALIHGSKATVPMPKHTGAVRSIENFLNWEFQVKPDYVYSERRMFSRDHNFCGTLDIAAYVDTFHLGITKEKCGSNMPAIIDIKTGKRVWPEYWLQTASYGGMLAEEQPKEFQHDLSEISRVIVNISQAEGTLDVHNEKSSIVDDYETFLALREVYRWKEGK